MWVPVNAKKVYLYGINPHSPEKLHIYIKIFIVNNWLI